MTRALVVKELRECAAVVALAALAVAFTLSNLWGVRMTPWNYSQPVEFPFFGDGFHTAFGLIGVMLAIVLGMKQTQWEVVRGTFPYLLFRPMSRCRIFLLKLAVGGGLVAVGMAAFILLHGVHAMTPGRQAFPFYWSMTIPTWQSWFVLPLVYSAAFLSGIRPGRWFGSKLLPLVGGGMTAFVLSMQPWWWLTLIGSAIGTTVCIFATLQIAETRDY